MSEFENDFIMTKSLFNSHIHLGGSLFEAVSSKKMNLSDFIVFSDYWNEQLKKTHQDKIAWNVAAKYSALLSKFYGTTSVCTMLGTEILKETALEKSLVGYPVMNSKKLSGFLSSLEENYARFRESVTDNNMKPGIFLHSLYANDEQTLKIVSNLLKTYPDDFLQIHIAEDTQTTNRVFEKYGLREIEILEKYNLLTSNTMLVHCCLLSNPELETVSKHKSKIIICPESNLRVGQVPIDPERLNKFNVEWFVATDGLGTGGTLNLLKQAKVLKSVYPNTTYKDLFRSITTRPDNETTEQIKIKLPHGLNPENLEKFLIENADTNVYNKDCQKLEKELKVVKLELKKYKPTLKDFNVWKKENKMIKYVFFDWGYTLINSFVDVDPEIEDIVSKYGKTWKDIFKYWRNYHFLHSLGRIKTKEEKYEQLSVLTGVSVEDLEKIGDLLLESHILDKDTADTIKYLHEKGYKLGIISNNIDEDVRYIINREGIGDLFEIVVCSSTVGERKPSAKIFLEAYKDIPKEEYQNILFVSDELSEDIIGSMALGTKNAWIFKNTVNSWRKSEPEIFETDYKIETVSELKNIL